MTIRFPLLPWDRMKKSSIFLWESKQIRFLSALRMKAEVR